MLELHPEILKKNGRNEFVVLPYEEFLELQQLLNDAQDLMDLRDAKKAEGQAPGITLAEARKELGL
jgi:hypothetical protein